VLSTTVTATLRWAALWAAIYGIELVGGAAPVRRTMVGSRSDRGDPPDLAERWAALDAPQGLPRPRSARAVEAPGVAARLAVVRAPALVVWGTRDDIFPPSHAQKLLAALPAAG
jgi:pimeloyl-ACP methyl ester carboxylesterase